GRAGSFSCYIPGWGSHTSSQAVGGDRVTVAIREGSARHSTLLARFSRPGAGTVRLWATCHASREALLPPREPDSREDPEPAQVIEARVDHRRHEEDHEEAERLAADHGGGEGRARC